MNRPLYTEIIVTGIIYKGIFNWYVGERDIWYLNYQIELMPEEFYPIQRKGIPVLDELMAEKFLMNMDEQMYSTVTLRQMFLSDSLIYGDEAIYDYRPCFLIDFDNQRFYSAFPELSSFEEQIPEHWTGYFKGFSDLIPLDYHYWKDENGIDFFEVK